jgi:hypothetical protein
LVPLYTTYPIKSGDLQWVGKSPSSPARQAKLKSTPYSSIAEFVAERFHTSVAFLAELNRGKNLDRLAPGDAVQVPNVAPLEIESLKPAADIPPKLELNSHVINVDTKKKNSRNQERRQPAGGVSYYTRVKAASSASCHMEGHQDDDFTLVSLGQSHVTTWTKKRGFLSNSAWAEKRSWSSMDRS